MDFIDEKDYLAVALCHFVDDGFEAFLELAFILGAGHEGSHVEGIDLFRFQVFGYVASHYAVCQAFGDGGLAGAGFAHEHGIVLGASRKNL